MNTFYQPILGDSFQLVPEEAHHAIRVLRHQSGDTIQATDGNGTWVTARIDRLTKHECHCIVLTRKEVKPRPFTLHLAIAPTKNAERMEWMMEKCVEVGIEQITFFESEHGERKRINSDRLIRVAISAMKQSQQAWLPRIMTGVSFEEVLQLSSPQKFIAHVDAANPLHLAQVAKPNQSSLILIGPEGDFTPSEILLSAQAGFTKVSLGTNRLRTETAGIYACCVLNAVAAY